MKRHGFNLPFHWGQVTSWVVMPLLCAEFFSLTVPNLQDGPRQAYISVYVTSFVLTVIFCVLCTIADPTDSALKLTRNGSTPCSAQLYPKLCVRCGIHVESHSKHCSSCQRCTSDFDHHCNWINNCIGRANYRLFAMMIGVLEVCMCTQTAATASVLSQTLQSGSDIKEKYDVGDKAGLYITTLLLTVVITGLASVFNGGLVIFHCYLRYNKLTTYDFIVARRQTAKVSHNYTETPNNLTGLPRSNQVNEQGETFRPENDISKTTPILQNSSSKTPNLPEIAQEEHDLADNSSNI